MKVNSVTLACTSLVGITTLSFAILSSSVALADTTVVSTASVTIAESCTMSGTTDTAHTANLVNGTYSGTDYTNGIGQTTLKAFCNDSAGFSVYAIGYTNNEYGNTYLHWNKASSDSDHTADIQTGIYTSDSTTNSTWSMKLAALTGTYTATIDDGNSSHNNSAEDYTTWHEVPDEYERVAYRTTGTDTNDNNNGTGSSITVTYDAYVSTAQPAGSYTGQVKFTMVHPNMSDNSNKPVAPLSPTDCPAYSICYAPNANNIEGSMSSIGVLSVSSTGGRQTETRNVRWGGYYQYHDDDNDGVEEAHWYESGDATNHDYVYNDIDGSTETVGLIAPNYKRNGYGFAGWSTEYDATVASNPTIYGPSEIINTDSSNGGIDLSTNGLILYPVWIASSGNLQNWNGCSALTAAVYNSSTDTITASLDSITALTDTRDGDVYAVAKLPDGKCWMVENLRLDGSATLTTTNTNNPLNDSGNVIIKIDYENNIVANHLPLSSDSWCFFGDGGGGWSGYERCVNQAVINTDNTNINGKNAAGENLVPSHISGKYNNVTPLTQWYSYGNYYNWYAATAGNGTYDMDVDNNGDRNAAGDICPAGWSLPTGGETSSWHFIGDFSNLSTAIGGDGSYDLVSEASYKEWLSYPLNFVHSGERGTDNIYLTDVDWYYWTRTSYGRSLVYILLMESGEYSGLYDFDWLKHLGVTVRCIADS